MSRTRGARHGLGRVRITTWHRLEVRGKKCLPGGTVFHDHDRRRDTIDQRQHRFDFTELDAIPMQLHLMVFAPEILERAIRTPACQVACPIQPPVGTPRVTAEPLGGKFRSPVIATANLHTANPQRARDPRRHWRAMRVQDMQGGVGDRCSNRNNVVRRQAWTAPRRHIDRRFRGTVQVVDGNPGQRLLGPGHHGRRQRLATHHDMTDRTTGRCRYGTRGGILHEHLQHGRNEVRDRDAFGTHQLCEIRAVGMSTRRREHERCPAHERPEELPHGHIEAVRRLLKDPVVHPEWIGGLHPPQPVCDPPLRVERTLRPTRRSRRVDHVRQMVGLHDRCQRLH